MTSSQRRIKQVIIGSLYVVVLTTFIFIVIVTFYPRKPVVTVEKLDIKPLQIVKYGAIKLDSGKSDFWAEINNPNDDFGAAEFKYTFILEDVEGNEIRKSDKSFILPGDKKRYVLLLNMNPDYKLVNFEFSSEPIWKQLSKLNLPELSIRNINLGISNKAGNKFTAFGILTNNSSVNLKNIQIITILTDDTKNILGINETSIRDVLTSESRDFEMTWDNIIPKASTANTVIYAQSNVLEDNELLIKLQQSPLFDR